MAPSSRTSTAGAGWEACSGCGAWKTDVPDDAKPLSWLRPATLWRSRNDVIARRFHDPVDAARMRWVRLARAQGCDPDFVVERASGDSSFLVIGDPGEGDDSQYAVVPGLLSQAEGVDFAVICSDLIYPTGDIGDYEGRFYNPYRKLHVPIFGVPGNHDWYDGLHGFMHHICGLDDPDAPLDFGSGVRRWIASRTWRHSVRPADDALAAMRGDREPCGQPGPYVAIDAGPLRIVTIDTGIQGGIDAEQAAWLERVSLADPRPKVLLTGKPIYVDGEYKAQQAAVDRIVTDPRANYVAAIGGDIHNYQRYPVKLPDGRTLQYVVSGGGGAFMHATHQIPVVDLPGVKERDFRCYPLRGDSLARYSQLYAKKLRQKWLELSPDEASSYMAGQLELDTTRPGKPVPLSRRARLAGTAIQPLPAGRGFQRFVSEAFDWNDPPMFKSFLRIDATASELRVRCFGVSGCLESEHAPPVEDDFTIPLN
ncbi:metallophosphoesterase family protein [Candidatus Solirubrobacter pratensis]|uniref:metallophosphoesterase family protein n=1 Tax=Candidatus Solirubrobacter pratensis TaxID=1298857 RepID=UPI000425E8C1|nr:metallophosphoesterase [Candidatus Solirubrobacter pratensis]